MTNLTNAQQPAYGLPTSHPSHMAPKTHNAHRAGGLVRTHSRTSSGGGSRLGLNQLQLTQKDAAPVKHTDRAKKSHLHHEVRLQVSCFRRLYPNMCPIFRVTKAQLIWQEIIAMSGFNLENTSILQPCAAPPLQSLRPAGRRSASPSPALPKEEMKTNGYQVKAVQQLPAMILT